MNHLQNNDRFLSSSLKNLHAESNKKLNDCKALLGFAVCRVTAMTSTAIANWTSDWLHSDVEELNFDSSFCDSFEYNPVSNLGVTRAVGCDGFASPLYHVAILAEPSEDYLCLKVHPDAKVFVYFRIMSFPAVPAPGNENHIFQANDVDWLASFSEQCSVLCEGGFSTFIAPAALVRLPMLAEKFWIKWTITKEKNEDGSEEKEIFKHVKGNKGQFPPESSSTCHGVSSIVESMFENSRRIDSIKKNSVYTIEVPSLG